MWLAVHAGFREWDFVWCEGKGSGGSREERGERCITLYIFLNVRRG